MKKLKAKHRKMTLSDKLYHVFSYIGFAMIALVCVFPFYYLAICTISDNKLVDLGRIAFWPVNVHFNNYLEVFKVQNLGNAAVVSLARTVIGTGASMLICSYMAYLFTKKDMCCRKLLYRMVVATMYFSAGMIPHYLNERMLGLVNTFWIYIVPSMVQVYNMILIKTNIEALPPDLEESAYLDGAGYMVRFIKIVFPLQKPILATTALFSAVGHWNDFFVSKLYITNTRLYTLQYVLYEYLAKAQEALNQIGQNDIVQISSTGLRLTLTIIVVVPILLVYPFIQKYYVKGLMVGAVKG